MNEKGLEESPLFYLVDLIEKLKKKRFLRYGSRGRGHAKVSFYDPCVVVMFKRRLQTLQTRPTVETMQSLCTEFVIIILISFTLVC